MRRILLMLILTSTPLLTIGQEMERLNALSYSTNPLRPLVGIVDLNVSFPTKTNQALIVGAHHYSYFYDYTRQNREGLNYLTFHTQEEYREWIKSDVISLDYRIYDKVQTVKNGRKVGRYVTILNRIPIVKWNYSRNIIVNPAYTRWYEETYNSDGDVPDGDMASPDDWEPSDPSPEQYIPSSYRNLNSRFLVPYRIGLEVGRKRMSTDPEKRMFNELGIAVFFGRVNGLTYGLPVLTYRLGLNHQ